MAIVGKAYDPEHTGGIVTKRDALLSVMRPRAKAAHKTGRAKGDFELREIGKEQYERFKALGI